MPPYTQCMSGTVAQGRFRCHNRSDCLLKGYMLGKPEEGNWLCINFKGPLLFPFFISVFFIPKCSGTA